MLAPMSASDHRLAQDARECHLRKGLAARLSEGIQLANLGKHGGRDLTGLEEAVDFGGAGIGGNTVEVAIGQQALSEQAKGNATDALIGEDLGETVFDPAFEEVILRLVDEAGGAQVAKDAGGASGLRGIVIGETDVEGLAGADGVRERPMVSSTGVWGSGR